MAPEVRRLAAIMFTDVAGYTALAQRDEAAALELLARHNALLRPFFPRFRGREIKTIGDSFLVEFESALDAANCAVDIQRFLREYNRSAPDPEKIRLRIGVHLGDVVHSEGDVFGDAVNLASRIEPLAEPEGVCVSGPVFEQIRNKVRYGFQRLEPRELKNVRYPLDVYRVALPGAGAEAGGPAAARNRVAVLPLANISPDPSDAFFADGMTDELISTLSRIGGLRVISRTSVMRYKNSAKGVRDIADELNVGSVLEGSVRKAGDELRITAQLIDAASDEHLWSEEYDTKFKDVFRIQKEIATHVARALEVQLLSSESRDLGKPATASDEAYLLYLRGRQHWNERRREANARAVELFERAIRLDSGFALAYAGLADCYVIYGDWGWMRIRDAFPRAKGHILRALELDPDLAEAHATLGGVYNSYEGNWRESERAYQRAIALKPSYATGHMWYALFLLGMGRYDDSLEELERARELDPLSWLVPLNRGYVLSFRGDRDAAAECFRAVVARVPDRAEGRVGLATELLLVGRTEEALEELRSALALPDPSGSTMADAASAFALAGRPEEARRIVEILDSGAGKALFPEPLKMAQVLFLLGRLDEGFRRLETAREEGSVFMNHASALAELRGRPWFAEVRRDRRWAAFEEGLPPAAHARAPPAGG